MIPNGTINEPSTYQAVRIGDIADWRLIAVISARGMSAWLKHQDPTHDIVTLFDETWNPDETQLLNRIESAVYDHPQVLDDFSADIAVVAPHTLWVPNGMAEDDEESAVDFFRKVYSCEPEDVMVSETPDATALFTLVPGLKAFLQRTFPGASIRSHLSVMTGRLRSRSADMPRVYIDVRDSEADFAVFDTSRFLMAATHQWHSLNDIQYHLFNIMEVYGLNPREVQVSLSGLRESRSELLKELRKTITYVMLTMVPGIGAKAGMPLCGSLMMRL